MSTTDIAIPYTQRLETVEWTASGSQNAFFLPWGTFVLESQIQAVQINGAPPLTVGSDYIAAPRQSKTVYDVPQPHGGWLQDSTADASACVWVVNAPAAGAVVKITYVVRMLNIAAPVPIPVNAPGGVLPAGDVRFSYSMIFPPPPVRVVPQQVMFQERTSLQVEFWRKTRKSGSCRNRVGIKQIRSARHWSPYWRSPVAVADSTYILDSTAALSLNGRQKQQYRLAYYDPASGARSALSDMTLYACVEPDRIRGNVSHPANSVWVGR